jgi:hypothetical protein
MPKGRWLRCRWTWCGAGINSMMALPWCGVERRLVRWSISVAMGLLRSIGGSGAMGSVVLGSRLRHADMGRSGDRMINAGGSPSAAQCFWTWCRAGDSSLMRSMPWCDRCHDAIDSIVASATVTQSRAEISSLNFLLGCMKTPEDHHHGAEMQSWRSF